MNCREFTYILAKLLLEMKINGDEPIVQYIYRSPEEQNRLYREGKSKCDGYKIQSQHQKMKAADIYLANDNGVIWEWDRKKAEQWHKRWQELGGEKVITWDLGHFEVK